MINSPYINKHGTLNAKLADGVAENAPLWSVEYLLLKHDEELFQSLIRFARLCKTETPGLYNQYPTLQNSHEDYTSPDQLMAYLAVFKLERRDDKIQEIWKYLLDHWGTYDNMTGRTNWQRIMQISAIAFAGACAGNKWAKIILAGACIYSCATNRGETSGKLKAWVMFKTLNMKFTETICTYFIKKTPFKNWKGIFFEYFQEEEHPIRKLLNE